MTESCLHLLLTREPVQEDGSSSIYVCAGCGWRAEVFEEGD